MRWACVIFVASAVLADLVEAGAWMRETGEVFLSVETRLRHRGAETVGELDIYSDYGLSPRLSLGVSVLEIGGVAGHAYGFARTPLPAGAINGELAAEFGLGAYHADGDWRGLGRLALAYGRGLTLGNNRGWFGVEAATEYRLGLNAPIYKLDAVAGQSSGGRVRPMAKLGLTHVDGIPLIWTASGHMLIDGPREFIWNIGLERKDDGVASTALSFGVWRRF